MKLAEGEEVVVTEERASDCAKFIYANEIKHGDAKIPASLVYYTYKMWKGFQRSYIPRAHFFREFSKLFESVRMSDGVYYLLDPKPFDLSREAYFLMKADQRAKRKKAPKSG